MKNNKKIAFISHFDGNIYLFRLSWIKALKDEGFEVYVLVPEGRYCEKLKKEKVKVINYKIKRGSLNPINALATVCNLYKIMKQEKFDLVQTFTLQPNVYGTIAAWLAGVPTVVNLVEGLGYVYTGNSFKQKILRAIFNILISFSFKKAKKIIFLNSNDLNTLGNLFNKNKAVIIRGTGINTEYYSPSNVDLKQVEKLRNELKIKGDDIVITIIARLYWSKGIREFVQAAKLLLNKYSNLKFLIVGPIDKGNPEAVPENFIKENTNQFIKFLGERDDIKEILFLTDIYVLPSYREGIPRTILEAMSMKKPIVTTNAPGCKETVEDGHNGFLVPIKDVKKLAEAVETLIKDESLRNKMGYASREKVKKEFSDEIVVNKVLKLYKDLLFEKDNAS